MKISDVLFQLKQETFSVPKHDVLKEKKGVKQHRKFLNTANFFDTILWDIENALVCCVTANVTVIAQISLQFHDSRFFFLASFAFTFQKLIYSKISRMRKNTFFEAFCENIKIIEGRNNALMYFHFFFLFMKENSNIYCEIFQNRKTHF